MIPDVAHAMIRSMARGVNQRKVKSAIASYLREEERGPIIGIIALYLLFNFADDIVNNLNIGDILWGVRTKPMSRRIQPEEMEEKDSTGSSESSVKSVIGSALLEKRLKLLERKVVKTCSICGESGSSISDCDSAQAIRSYLYRTTSKILVTLVIHPHKNFPIGIQRIIFPLSFQWCIPEDRENIRRTKGEGRS
jgi:hypothetical protein